MPENDRPEKSSRVKAAQIKHALNRLILAAEEYHRARRALLASDIWDADGSVNWAVESSTHLDEAVREALATGATVEDILTNVTDLPNWLRDELLRPRDDYFWRSRRALPWEPDGY